MTHRRQILEARALFQRAVNGDYRAIADVQDLLQGRPNVVESMSTSDFPILLGAGFEREMLQEYQSIAPVWQQFSRRVTVRNFKPQTLVEILGGRAGLDKVKQGAEYKARALTEGKYEFKVEKYGARIPLTWEMLVNDELGAFDDLGARLATAARETEELVALAPIFNGNKTGLNTNFWTGVAAPQNPVLTEASLEAALIDIANRKDSDGRPIVLSGAILMVSPALAPTARRILNAREIRRTNGDVTTIEANALAGAVRIVENPWLPIYAPSYANVNTMWMVLPDPNAGRPALVTGFLRGYETPDLRTKSDTGTRIGGGAIPASEGSFDDDTIQYRVRHNTGGAALVNIAAYVSTGTASA